MARHDVSEDDSDDMSVQMTSKGKENAPPAAASAAVKRKKLAQLDRTLDDSLMAAEDEAPPARPPKPTASSSKPRPTPAASKPSASTSSPKPSTSSKPATTKKTAHPPRPVVEEAEEGDDSLMNDDAAEDVFGEQDVAQAGKKAKPPKSAATVPATVDKKGRGKPNGVRESGEEREVGTDVKSLLGRIKKLERSVYEITAERDAFEKERDTYSRQFDELSKVRETDAEKSFRSYREKAESRAEKLNDLNKALTASLEKEKKERQRLIAAGPQVVAPVVPEPVKGTKELEKMVKEQTRKTKEQAELIEQLQRELKAEVANSRQLLNKSATASKATASTVAAPVKSDEVTNDQRIAVFYEDLTKLSVVTLKFPKNDEAQGVLEPEFNCVYNWLESDVPGESRSLNFKIRQANRFSETKHADGEAWPYDSVVVYTPLGLENESPEFVESLEFLDGGFTTAWDKVHILWREIVGRVGVEEDEQEE